MVSDRENRVVAEPDDRELKRRQKVVAAEDLPAVPAGTPGKVLLVNGLTWIRYRVAFDNGIEIGTLDRDVLATRDEWAQRPKDRPDSAPAA
jgi:hypothetical protein